MTETASPLLECRHLDVEIGEHTLVRDLNLRVEAGQCWCILGRNGSGKTTLLHTLAGLHRPTGGTITLGGDPLGELERKQVARRLGILFQSQLDSFPATVFETVLQGRHPHLNSWQWESAADERIAEGAINTLELDALRARNVQSLSGGERQRVAIATLLAQQTDLMLLDEPSNHLDLNHRLGILETLTRTCRERRKALVMSLHDINLAARFCDHALLLPGNTETLLGPIDTVLNTSTLTRLYGHPLIEVRGANGRAWIPE